jgi:hypothetical protein
MFARNQRAIKLINTSEIIASEKDVTDLEPRPIGPCGVEQVVPVVSSTALTAWALGSNTELDIAMFTSLLEGVMPFDEETECVPAEEFDAFCQRVSLIHPIEHQEKAEAVSVPSASAIFKTRDKPKVVSAKRSRKYQAGQWMDRYDELIQFRARHGHMFVPHSYSANQKLAQWVKRQRYQYKLKSMGHHSTLSDERQQILTSVGFIWDSHAASWQEQFQLLEEFYLGNGHCNVPSHFNGSGSLNVWCKHQRKQYRLYKAGIVSTLTEERYQCLDSIGFNWNPRNVTGDDEN